MRTMLAENHLMQQKLADNWHVPLSGSDTMLLDAAVDEMTPFKLHQEEVPFIIRLIENPKYYIGLFPGAISLLNHDCIHILLGRGTLLKDEAFVIGYTMGSSKKMTRLKERLFLFTCSYLYPKDYKFGKDEAVIFRFGLEAGSECAENLTKVEFSSLMKCQLQEVRETLGINIDRLKSFYTSEKEQFPNSIESQRLL